ncbi:hypothetical protein BD779DRAFT_1438157 [Infundibulicybe gibba]|nr:hypothetical protein BD779DRAFT_1438157 [Infundibulicybe gibba]
MARAFCIPGIIFLAAAFVLSLITSISLPFLPALDVARTRFDSSEITFDQSPATEIRLGVWTPCYYNKDDTRTCLKSGYGYTVPVNLKTSNQTQGVTISGTWTRGLAVHPVATAVTLIALLFSVSTHITLTLISSLLAFLAATLTLIAFIIDIALFARLGHEVRKLPGSGSHTRTGPGFWLTFASLILLVFGGLTVCFGRRKDRLAGATAVPTANKRTGKWWRFRR